MTEILIVSNGRSMLSRWWSTTITKGPTMSEVSLHHLSFGIL